MRLRGCLVVANASRTGPSCGGTSPDSAVTFRQFAQPGRHGGLPGGVEDVGQAD